MESKPKFVLCPYCGHTQSASDRCLECGGLFEPLSRKATQIAMGPWYIRDKAKPFRPGCSYEVLCKQIQAGKVRSLTVLRGPTTRQFWSVARHVPGVAHLVGYCHACEAHVQPTADRCHKCNTKFQAPDHRNELGLAFSSKQEVAAAQASLDRELAAATGQQPPEGASADKAPSFSAAGLNSPPTQAPGAKPTDSDAASPEPAPPTAAAPSGVAEPSRGAAPSGGGDMLAQALKAAEDRFGAADVEGDDASMNRSKLLTFEDETAPSMSDQRAAATQPRALDFDPTEDTPPPATPATPATPAASDRPTAKQPGGIGAMAWAAIAFNALAVLIVIGLLLSKEEPAAGNAPASPTAADASPATAGSPAVQSAIERARELEAQGDYAAALRTLEALRSRTPLSESSAQVDRMIRRLEGLANQQARPPAVQ